MIGLFLISIISALDASSPDKCAAPLAEIGVVFQSPVLSESRGYVVIDVKEGKSANEKDPAPLRVVVRRLKQNGSYDPTGKKIALSADSPQWTTAVYKGRFSYKPIEAQFKDQRAENIQNEINYPSRDSAAPVSQEVQELVSSLKEGVIFSKGQDPKRRLYIVIRNDMVLGESKKSFRGKLFTREVKEAGLGDTYILLKDRWRDFNNGSVRMITLIGKIPSFYLERHEFTRSAIIPISELELFSQNLPAKIQQ